MDYLDNPRKVYGRVDIIYSDSQISDDIIQLLKDSEYIKAV